MVDPAFLPLAALVKPQVTRKPGDIAKALLTGFKATAASPRKEQGYEDDATISTEASPDSKRATSTDTPQKMNWL